MLQRCTNKKNKWYKYYGARGIKVCERWLDFRKFLKDMGLKENKALSLERVDNNKGYNPINCIWDTRSNQNRNRRNYKRINR